MARSATADDATARRFTERHREVLDAAMALIAERGLRGASLRALARRLNMSQPSLYHYFGSKDELVEQIIELRTGVIFELPANLPDLDDLRGLLRAALDRVIAVYEGEQQVVFVRFMFAITMERPELGGRLRDRMFRRGFDLARPYLQRFVERGRILAEDRDWLLRAALNALALKLIEERVLLAGDYGEATDVRAYADFIVDVMVSGALARCDRRRKGRQEGS